MVEQPLRVLVVEDNPGDAALIERGLEASRVPNAVTVVTDGEAALDYLYRRNGYETASTPDLVLLDLNLPRRTGSDVLDRIRDEPDLGSIPLLVLSGSAAETHVRETYRSGADGYLVKPVDPHAFISLVETVANSAADVDSLPQGEFDTLDPAS